MAFEKEISLKDCKYRYQISPNVKKYTLRDTTFTQTTVGHYQLTRLLEKVPNSGEGFPLKITINKELNGFKSTSHMVSRLVLIRIPDEPFLISPCTFLSKCLSQGQLCISFEISFKWLSFLLNCRNHEDKSCFHSPFYAFYA